MNMDRRGNPSSRPRRGDAHASPLTRRRVLTLLALATAGAALPSCAHDAAVAGAGARTPLSAADREAFLAAVRRGDAATIERLLDRDATLVHATDDEGRSTLVVACLARRQELAPLLVQRGLELDVVDAVLLEDWERVEALAAAHPEAMNAAHPIGGNPLYASGLVGGSEQYRLRSLGCDSNGRPAGGSGLTPARAAMACRDPLGAWLAATDILSNGGHVNAEQAGGDSVVHGAVRARDERLVRLALRKGGDPAARDEQGHTPRDLADALGWEAGVTLLDDHARIPRDHRASQFAFDANRRPFTWRPLDDVPRARQSEITGRSHFDLERVTAMLADDPRLVHALSTDDELAIEACGHTGRRDVIRLHLDHGAPLSLPTALSLGDLDHARWLLDRDPLLVHERGPHDFPVMWYPAIGGGSLEAAELLLERGAPIEQESGGETALHRAAWLGRAELARFLVERGADLRAVGHRQDRAGLTPLGMARSRGKGAAAKALEELGATA